MFTSHFVSRAIPCKQRKYIRVLIPGIFIPETARLSDSQPVLPGLLVDSYKTLDTYIVYIVFGILISFEDYGPKTGVFFPYNTRKV
jgi:hypothetical protein